MTNEPTPSCRYCRQPLGALHMSACIFHYGGNEHVSVADSVPTDAAASAGQPASMPVYCNKHRNPNPCGLCLGEEIARLTRKRDEAIESYNRVLDSRVLTVADNVLLSAKLLSCEKERNEAIAWRRRVEEEAARGLEEEPESQPLELCPTDVNSYNNDFVHALQAWGRAAVQRAAVLKVAIRTLEQQVVEVVKSKDAALARADAAEADNAGLLEIIETVWREKFVGLRFKNEHPGSSLLAELKMLRETKPTIGPNTEAELDELRERCKALEDALRPFAAVASRYITTDRSRFSDDQLATAVSCRLGGYRAAADALAE